MASVIAREFSGRLMDRLTGPDYIDDAVLAELKGKQLICEKSAVPERAFTFKHALTQEVGYSSLLMRRRIHLHHAVAIAIEQAYAGRIGEYLGLLAYHYSKAEAWDKALEYLVHSAQKAAKAFGVREALVLYEEAVQVARRVESVPTATLLDIHRVRSDLFFAVSDFVHAQAEADELLNMAGIGYAGMGEYQAAVDALEEGRALVEKLGDERFLCMYLNTLGWLHIECGDFDPGLELNSQSLELARRDRHASGTERAAFTLLNEGDALLATGNLEAAAGKLGHVLHIVQHPPASRWMTWRYATHCYASLAELTLARSDATSADAFADQSLEIAVRTSSRKFACRAWRAKGESARMSRQWDRAEEALARSLTIAHAIDEPRQLWKNHVSIGDLNRGLKRAEAAQRCYSAAQAIVERLIVNTRHPGLRAGLESQLRSVRQA